MRAPLGPGTAKPLLIPLEIQKNRKQQLRDGGNPSVPRRMVDAEGWSIGAVEYYAAAKREDAPTPATARLPLEDNVPSDVRRSQDEDNVPSDMRRSQKDKSHVSPRLRESKRVNSQRRKVGWRGRETGT